MLQNPCKTLGFKKNMVYKIPPGGGGGKPYPASGLFLLTHFLSILPRVFLMMSNRDVYKIGSTIGSKYRNVAQSSFSLPCVSSAILRFHAFLLQHFLSILPRVFLMMSNRDVYKIGSTIGSKYRNVAQITRIMRRSFESSFSLPCVSSTILRM